MKKYLYTLSIQLILILLCSGCKRDFSEILNSPFENLSSKSSKSTKGVLEVIYEITTYVDYKADFEKLSAFDLAYLNPKADKQRVEMVLLPSGEINMIIEKQKMENPINLPHKTIPSDIPEVVRTEIFGSQMSFYDATGKLIGTEKTQLPRQTQLLEELKKMGSNFSEEEMAQAIATMQGQFFVKNMEMYLREVEALGAFVQQHDGGYVTVRQDLSKMGINQKGTNVSLLDMKQGKMLAYVIYDENEKIVQSTSYKYHREGVPSVEAIRIHEILELPSGIEVTKITLMKFDNTIHKLNISNLR